MPEQDIRLIYATGECEIDFVRRELRVLGAPVPVGGRAFEVIEVLARMRFISSFLVTSSPPAAGVTRAPATSRPLPARCARLLLRALRVHRIMPARRNPAAARLLTARR